MNLFTLSNVATNRSRKKTLTTFSSRRVLGRGIPFSKPSTKNTAPQPRNAFTAPLKNVTSSFHHNATAVHRNGTAVVKRTLALPAPIVLPKSASGASGWRILGNPVMLANKPYFSSSWLKRKNGGRVPSVVRW